MGSLKDNVFLDDIRPQGAQNVKKFTGTLAGFEVAEDNGLEWITVYFTDVVVEEAYTPTAEVTLDYRVPKMQWESSAWGMFATSLKNSLPEKDRKRVPLSRFEGARMKVEQVALPAYTDKKTGEQVVRHGYRVVEVLSMPGKAEVQGSTLDYALALMEGKSWSEFAQAAMQDATIKADQELITQVITKQLASRMEVAMMYEVDAEGKYVKRPA